METYAALQSAWRLVYNLVSGILPPSLPLFLTLSLTPPLSLLSPPSLSLTPLCHLSPRFLPLSDMAVPALARFGSNELKKNFLAPSIAGDFVACLGVSEPGAGSDVASIRTNAKPKKGALFSFLPLYPLSIPIHVCSSNSTKRNYYV